MSLSILSTDGRRKAVVTEHDSGCSASYFRSMDGGWTPMRTAMIPQPFHVALDIAAGVVNTLQRVEHRPA